MLQDQIDHFSDLLAFEQGEKDWVCFEGKSYRKFLHLEDIKTHTHISSLWNRDGKEVSKVDEILDVLHDFYQTLYCVADSQKSPEEIKAFLLTITSLPLVKYQTVYYSQSHPKK